MLSGLIGWVEGLGTLAGPYADLLGISVPALALGGVVVRLIDRRRLSRSATVVEGLQRDRASWEKRAAKLDSEKAALQHRLAGFEARLPETVLAAAERERREGNHNKADQLLATWTETEGEQLSDLLSARAEWALAHAAGDHRAAGLATAEAWATASLVLWRYNRPAEALLGEIASWRREEGQPLPPLAEAVAELAESTAVPAFAADAVEWALAASRTVNEHLKGGRYHLALPVAERAVRLLRRNLGAPAVHTLEAQYQKCQVLQLLGRSNQALPIAEEVAEAMAASPALGPVHRFTLASRYLVAQLLGDLGRTEKALPIAKEVAEAEAASPAFGPAHPSTLASRYLVAQLLDKLGRTDKALPIAEEVAEAMTASTALGSAHPDTLASRYLVAELLSNLGRAEKALPIAEEVAEARTASTALGPAHPSTLVSRCLVAQLLGNLGRTEKALPIAEEVAEAMAASPALGPVHHFTLASRHLVAQLLLRLGRAEQALPIAEEVGEANAASPALGPAHHLTLSSRHLVAQLLGDLGRTEKALRIAEEVAEARAASPALGPAHPDTLASRELVESLSTGGESGTTGSD